MRGPTAVRIRRVVTGEPESGQSRFTHIEDVEPFVNGLARIYSVWGYDEAPQLPICMTSSYDKTSLFPPADGVRVHVITFPPPVDDSSGDTRDRAAELEVVRRMNEVPAGLQRPRGPGIPSGMHRTDTIDIGIVISGTIGLICTDGQEELLQLGDVFVQNGAMHAWRGLDREHENSIAVITLPATRSSSREALHDD
jgi:hypothetical protein